MDLFDLVAKITLDADEYEQGLEKAGKKASNFGGALGKAFKVGGGAVAAVTTATAAATAAFVNGASNVAAYGDNIDKMSQKMGMSAEAYQEWDAVMQHSGASIDSMQRGMTTLSQAVENGNVAFESLGISLEDAASMSQEELFEATITALQGMESGTERTVLAQKLLGGSAKELGALLNTSAEDTEAMRKRVHELGGVMSDEAVKAAAAFQDSLQDLQTSFGGLKRNMLSQFMPAITTVMDGLTNLFAGNGGIEQISEGVGQFVDTLSGIIPDVLATGSQILLALGSAITENLPVLVDAATQTILTLGTGLIENLPMLAGAGLQILLSLAQSIGENLPTLIPTIVDVVLQMVETLTSPKSITSLIEGAITLILGLADGFIRAMPRIIQSIPVIISNVVHALVRAIPQIISAGVQLFVALVTNLPTIIVEIVKAIPQIIDGIVSALAEGWEIMKEAGKNLLTGLWNGISEAGGWLWQQVRGFLGDLWDGILDFFGIASPSKEMAWVGEMLVDGLGNSIKKNGGEAVDAAEKMSEDILSTMDDLSNNDFGANIDISKNVSNDLDKMESSFAKSKSKSASAGSSSNGIETIPIIVQCVLDGQIVSENTTMWQRKMARAVG